MSKKDGISHVKFQYKVAWRESIPALEWIKKIHASLYTSVVPRPQWLQTLGLCGTSAHLRGEPSTSGSSFSWNGRKKKNPITATEQSNEEIQVGKRHTTPNLKSKIILPVNKKPWSEVSAYLTFLPFSDTFVLLRIPAFSKFCTWKRKRWRRFRRVR